MKYVVEEEYTGMRTYEVEAKSKKHAKEIYWETESVADSEFDREIKTITALKNEKN